MVICKIKILSCERNKLKNFLKTNQTNKIPQNLFNIPTPTGMDKNINSVPWENVQINLYKTSQKSKEKEWLIFASYWGHSRWFTRLNCWLCVFLQAKYQCHWNSLAVFHMPLDKYCWAQRALDMNRVCKSIVTESKLGFEKKYKDYKR